MLLAPTVLQAPELSDLLGQPNSNGDRRVVTLVSLDSALNVHVPFTSCPACLTPCHVSPLGACFGRRRWAGFFPATLNQALKLWTAPTTSSMVWFDMQLLDTIISLQARFLFTYPLYPSDSSILP